jgi:hypothetical protein
MSTGWLRVLEGDEGAPDHELVNTCVMMQDGGPEVQPLHVVHDDIGALPHSPKRKGQPRQTNFLDQKELRFPSPPSGYFPYRAWVLPTCPAAPSQPEAPAPPRAKPLVRTVEPQQGGQNPMWPAAVVVVSPAAEATGPLIVACGRRV